MTPLEVHVSPGHIAGAFLTLGAVVAVVGGWVKWLGPRWRRARAKWIAAIDSIVGREALVDSITGEEKVPALPGIGVRMAHQEERANLQDARLDKITAALEKVADQTVAIADLKDRVTKLELAAVERVVGKAESVAAWRAVETAIKATPDIEGEAIEDTPES